MIQDMGIASSTSENLVQLIFTFFILFFILINYKFKDLLVEVQKALKFFRLTFFNIKEMTHYLVTISKP